MHDVAGFILEICVRRYSTGKFEACGKCPTDSQAVTHEEQYHDVFEWRLHPQTAHLVPDRYSRFKREWLFHACSVLPLPVHRYWPDYPEQLLDRGDGSYHQKELSMEPLMSAAQWGALPDRYLDGFLAGLWQVGGKDSIDKASKSAIWSSDRVREREKRHGRRHPQPLARHAWRHLPGGDLVGA